VALWFGEMRITGGTLGGRVLWAPKNKETRPTADATRETLFNILQNGIGIDFTVTLDLFAGSGAVAFETISRGAQRSILFESNKQAQAAIAKNADSLGISGQIHVIRDEAIEKWSSHLKKALATGELIDFVFSDPPYAKGLAGRSFGLLTGRVPELFSADCCWVIELARDEVAPEAPEGWQLLRERESGAAKLIVYRRVVS
jgi:16S rRNA (guanine966-N2)-methyltransferase